ncbi:HNH endonuclease [Clostridium estertheticum]|uniref:HNH endonuclease n=2 Tax=Clostridium estertheticum TaxID=238834 RepID=UPI001C7D1C9C|nr:HNH endonuclease [Clostridium estertheticum]MBX4258394.1 HNH endonuclease [Clostridium estertheticum]WLC69651.1 HNH endonuclease [Clostridium estertheticum]
MLTCEVCGNPADKHHIVYKSQGGIEFPLNFRYLCTLHHRGETGPHKNRRLDLEYKIDMQRKLEDILIKEIYPIEELEVLLKINKGMIKRLFKDYKLKGKGVRKADIIADQNDIGYKRDDIIFRLMGGQKYDENMLLEEI